jgi:hypothetical protein
MAAMNAFDLACSIAASALVALSLYKNVFRRYLCCTLYIACIEILISIIRFGPPVII